MRGVDRGRWRGATRRCPAPLPWPASRCLSTSRWCRRSGGSAAARRRPPWTRGHDTPRYEASADATWHTSRHCVCHICMHPRSSPQRVFDAPVGSRSSARASATRRTTSSPSSATRTTFGSSSARSSTSARRSTEATPRRSPCRSSATQARDGARRGETHRCALRPEPPLCATLGVARCEVEFRAEGGPPRPRPSAPPRGRRHGGSHPPRVRAPQARASRRSSCCRGPSWCDGVPGRIAKRFALPMDPRIYNFLI